MTTTPKPRRLTPAQRRVVEAMQTAKALVCYDGMCFDVMGSIFEPVNAGTAKALIRLGVCELIGTSRKWTFYRLTPAYAQESPDANR